jgi:hypothetical protein
MVFSRRRILVLDSLGPKMRAQLRDTTDLPQRPIETQFQLDRFSPRQKSNKNLVVSFPYVSRLNTYKTNVDKPLIFLPIIVFPMLSKQ